MSLSERRWEKARGAKAGSAKGVCIFLTHRHRRGLVAVYLGIFLAVLLPPSLAV